MKTGDPKKAAVLGVVALAILGVAVFRILPKDSGRTVGSTAVADEPAGSETVRPSAELRRNPFYHPGLESATGESQATEGDEPEPTPRPSLPSLGEGTIPADWLPDGVDVRPAPGQGAPPAENAGKNQQQNQKRKVVVNAVLEVAQRLAYVSVDGEEYRVGAGDTLPNVGTVVSITRRGVVVKTRTAKVTLPVGEWVEL